MIEYIFALIFILSAWFINFFVLKLDKKYSKQIDKQKNITLKYFLPINSQDYLTRIISLVVYSILSYLFIEMLSDELSIAIRLLSIGIFSLILWSLFYLMINDLWYMEIPSNFTNVIVILTFLMNVILFFVLEANEIIITDNYAFKPIYNLITGATYGFIFWLIWKTTKEKGLGAGDILVALVIGFTIGPIKTITSFYISIFSALVVGLVYGIFVNKYKDLRIPFLPFLILGAIISFFIPWDIIDFVDFFKELIA